MDEYTHPLETISSDEDYAALIKLSMDVYKATQVWDDYKEVAIRYIRGKADRDVLEYYVERWFAYPADTRKKAIEISEQLNQAIDQPY